MRIDIMTLFPETLGDVLSESILGRAQERGFIRIDTHQIRDYTANKQNQTDHYPCGGGRGAGRLADHRAGSDHARVRRLCALQIGTLAACGGKAGKTSKFLSKTRKKALTKAYGCG